MKNFVDETRFSNISIRKKKKLKSLREKASERHADEFYFGMLSRKGTTDSKHPTGTVNGDRGNRALNQDAVRLFKTQDLGYVRAMRNKTAKEVDFMKRQLVGIRGDGERVVFVDDEVEQADKAEEDGEREGEDQEMDLADNGPEAELLRKRKQKQAKKLETMLRAAEDRLQSLAQVEEALDLQRAKMAKSPTVGGVNKHGVKFKIRERKR